jgi:uncharacterized protein involved in exopolysaccharide biosynthesis
MEHSLNNELSPARRSQALAREVGPQRNDISLTEICAVIRKRKLAVLGCLGFTLALASLYCIMAPRKYEATARVVINPDNSNPLGIAMGDMNPFTDASLMQETQVRVMQSDAVAWDVIQQLKLDQNQEFAPTKKGERREPIEAITPLHRYRLLANFHGRLNVASVPKTALVELRFRSKDPKLAADIVNAVANVYMERNFRTRYNATMQASDWLAKQLDDLKAKAVCRIPEEERHHRHGRFKRSEWLVRGRGAQHHYLPAGRTEPATGERAVRTYCARGTVP